MSVLNFQHLLALATVGWAGFYQPEPAKIANAPKMVSTITISDSGKILAQDYCQRCHLFPEANLLDKKTWKESVLPNMALRLGLKHEGLSGYEGLPEEEIREIKSLGIYPDQPLISEEDWQKIVDYYVKMAPENPLPQISALPVNHVLPQFSIQTLSVGENTIPKTTMLEFSPDAKELYVGDDQNMVYVLDSKFKVIKKWWIESSATDIDFPKNEAPRLLTIGVFNPSDQKKGTIMSLEMEASATNVNLNNLPRSVYFDTGDLNQDGKEDIIICGFGNYAGKLFWYDDFDEQKEHIISPLAGSRKVVLKDMNNDGKVDIIALRAQAYEGITIYYNLGKGKFKEKPIMSFQPAFGASYFEMVDFNKDGKLDILLTNGDNWDYSSINKNYHGVRIFLNDGKDNFKQSYFYPLYGTNKALARDFDQDGDLDIAVTSFYSDLADPQQAFTYLSNQGNLKFEAFTTPEATKGKWLVMDVADYDQDGDLDIVLGSYFQSLAEVTQLAFKGILDYPQLLILTNNLKK